MDSYAGYALSEWDAYSSHPERYRASLAAVAGREIAHVLDVGCGAGQELLPFAKELGARCTGVDILPIAIDIARQQFGRLDCADHVAFFCCPAESLPFANASFDLVMCRVALPYMHNEAALCEMGRVLRHGGLLILKIHHARYYWRRFWRSLARGQFIATLGLVRVLAEGTIYQLSGWQPGHKKKAHEVFQTRWSLKRILARFGLEIRGELENSDSNRRSPVYLIEKTGEVRMPGVKMKAIMLKGILTIAGLETEGILSWARSF